MNHEVLDFTGTSVQTHDTPADVSANFGERDISHDATVTSASHLTFLTLELLYYCVFSQIYRSVSRKTRRVEGQTGFWTERCNWCHFVSNCGTIAEFRRTSADIREELVSFNRQEVATFHTFHCLCLHERENEQLNSSVSFFPPSRVSGVDPELYELTTAKLDPGISGSRVADAFARLMSTMEKTSTSTRSGVRGQGSGQTTSQLVSTAFQRD